MQDTGIDIQSVFGIGEDNFDEDDEVIELTKHMIVRKSATGGHRFSKVIVLLVLATVAVLFGAVQAWVWSLYTVTIYAAFMVFSWRQSLEGAVVKLNGYAAAIGLFFVLTLLSCLPLSSQMMRVLSPVRYQLLVWTKDLTGLKAAWPTLSYAPLQSLGWWSFMLALGMLFVMLRTFFASNRMLQCALQILLGLAVVEGLYGILQALIPNLGVLWYIKSGLGDARGTWINRNHFAGFMGMMLPLFLGFSLSRVRWGARLNLKAILQSDRIHQYNLLLLALLIMTLSLLFSKSRAGIMSMSVGVGTFLFLIRSKDRKLPKRYWIIVCVLFGLTFLYGLRMGFDPIAHRFLALDKHTSRMDYWQESLAIIKDHPLGIGLATFKYVFPVYNVRSLSETVMPYYLHNDVLQILVETGWPGFLLIISTYMVFMVDNFRRIRRMQFYADPQKFLITVGAFSGLVSISFHSFFDFNLQIPANAVFFVALLSMVSPRCLPLDD